MVKGAVAQLGERLPCTEEVRGSNPLSSTINLEPESLRGSVPTKLQAAPIRTLTAFVSWLKLSSQAKEWR